MLAEAKAKLAKNFEWSKARYLSDATALVVLRVFGRDDEAREARRSVTTAMR